MDSSSEGKAPGSGHEGASPATHDAHSMRALFVIAVCSLVFLTLVHEFGYSYTSGPSSAVIDGSYTSCLLRSVGICVGGLGALLLSSHFAASMRTGRLMLIGVVGLLCSGALFYAAIAASLPAIVPCVIGMAASADAAIVLTFCICLFRHLSIRTVAFGLSLSIGLCAFAEFGASFIAQTLPLAAASVFHLSFAAAAIIAAAHLLRDGNLPLSINPETSVPESTGDHATAKRRTPWQPVAHFLCYGFAIGFLHTVLGVFRILGPERYLFSLLGSFIAAALVLATYAHTAATSREVWTNLRRLVFPLITGFVMITSLFHSFSAYTFLYVSSCYYGCLFVLGCIFAADQTIVPVSKIVSCGFMFVGFGIALGSLCGILPLVFDQRDDSVVLSACMLLAFTAVTVGTFWIGDDHALRTWWGLRKKLTARQYHDQEMSKRCKAIAKTYMLSERETEVLLLLAQGRRAAQIKDDLSISITTVRTHTRNIYSKLDVHSSKQLTDVVESIVP